MKTSFDTYFESQMKDAEFRSAYQIAESELHKKATLANNFLLNLGDYMLNVDAVVELAEEFVKLAEAYNKPRKGMKRRWSVKFKKKINCSNPKGFSQKQYCKRKRRGGDYKE